MQRILELRKSIFATASKILSRPSRLHELTTYYPPDISAPRLANQDPKLKALRLRDVWFDAKRDKEIQLEARRKKGNPKDS